MLLFMKSPFGPIYITGDFIREGDVTFILWTIFQGILFTGEAFLSLDALKDEKARNLSIDGPLVEGKGNNFWDHQLKISLAPTVNSPNR